MNDALFRMKVSKQSAFTRPFTRECDGCYRYTKYSFSHFRMDKGTKLAVYYCTTCHQEFTAEMGSRQ